MNHALPDWNALAGVGDEALPLLDVALLIARDEYPDLDPTRYDALLDAHAVHLAVEVDAIAYAPLKMQAINRYLFDELGYTGDDDAFYDPRNSYLNEVVERRRGNPISLATVQMDVARRLGVPLDGISFPGHFLVRLPVDDGMLIMDPFNSGRPLDIDELRDRAKPHLGGDTPDDEVLSQILSPASHRTMLTRMLRNLHSAYREQGDWVRAVRCADRVLKLLPDAPDALRERGLGYLQLGHLTGARDDLGRYLLRHPDAEDAARVREQLVQCGRDAGRRH